MDFDDLKKRLEIAPLTLPAGVDLAADFDCTAYIRAEIIDAFCIPPRVLYSRFKPYLIVDNTK